MTKKKKDVLLREQLVGLGRCPVVNVRPRKLMWSPREEMEQQWGLGGNKRGVGTISTPNSRESP